MLLFLWIFPSKIKNTERNLDMADEKLILVINFGSTSTKLSIFKDKEEIQKATINHSREELFKYATNNDQIDMRTQAVEKFLNENGYKLTDFSAIASRAANTPSIELGCYEINQLMVDRLLYKPTGHHISNICPAVSYNLACKAGIKAYIYDSPVVDERIPEARLSGHPEITKTYGVHGENMRAVAIRAADQLGKPLRELNFAMAHLGGGITMCAMKGGVMVDMYSDECGAFTPERTGILPPVQVLDYCFNSGKTHAEIYKMLRGQGGMYAYLGTADGIEVENRLKAGDPEATLVIKAMALQIAKELGEMAVTLCGNVDAIVITGGFARFGQLIEWVREHTAFIAPIILFPGEYEMEHMAYGVLRAINGEEAIKQYVDDDYYRE